MNDAHVQLRWVRPPRQARSQQTLERLLDAAEGIIAEKGIDNATVAEVARRAESSVGAFYTRFADKEALMRCLFERFHEQAVATTEAVLTPERWDGVPLEAALEMLVRFTLEMSRERRRLIAALVARAANDPSLGAFAQRLHGHITKHMHALVIHRGVQLSHADPERAVRMAVWMVLGALESSTLYDVGGAPMLPDETIAAEIARMLMSYVGVGVDAHEESLVTGP